MSRRKRVRSAAGATALGAATVLTAMALTPVEASAAVSLPNCTSSHNGSTIILYCPNPTDSGWYQRLQCERWRNGAIYYVNGTLVWGSGYSQANCGAGDPDSSTVVNL